MPWLGDRHLDDPGFLGAPPDAGLDEFDPWVAQPRSRRYPEFGTPDLHDPPANREPGSRVPVPGNRVPVPGPQRGTDEVSIERHTGPLPVFSPDGDVRGRMTTANHNGSGAYRTDPPPSQPQTIQVSVPALRTFVTLGGVVVISVVLSVITTIALIAVMNAGVILPQYSRFNQPTQVGQLGICVSKNGTVTTPTHVGFCHGGKFIHVQPKLTSP